MTPAEMIAAGVPDAFVTGLAQVNAAALAAMATLHASHASDDDHLEIDDNGFLVGRGVTVVRSVRSQALAPGMAHINGLVAHWTDTRGCGAVNLARRIAGPIDAQHARSCHLWIDAAGEIAQSVSFLRGSWHAGGYQASLFLPGNGSSTSKDVWYPQKPGAGGFSANSWAGGIELENVGEVRFVDGKWLGWPFKFGGEAPAVVDETEVVVDTNHPGQGHHRFTREQVASARRVYLSVIRRYDLKRPNCAWGHYQIDPQNRTDPGPLWCGKGAILDTILAEAFPS